MSLRIIRVQLLALVASLVLFGGLAASAGAADFCVGSHPLCVGTSYPATEQGIRDALAATNVAAGSDRVYIAAGDYMIGSTISITPNAQIQIIGEGASTKLKAGANAMTVLNVLSNSAPTSLVSDLAIESKGFTTGAGLTLMAGTVDRVRFEITSTGSVVGLNAYDTTVLHSQFVGVGNGTRLIYSQGATDVSDSTFTGDGNGSGFRMSGTGTRTLERLKFSGLRTAAIGDSGVMDISDSVADLGSVYGAGGFLAENYNNGTAALGLNAENVTVVGSGDSQTGLAVSATGTDAATENSTGTIVNSLVHLTGASNVKAIRCDQTGANTTASLDISYSAFNPARLDRDAGCSGTTTNTLDTSVSAPVFNQASVGDYRPTGSSPVVDAGDPGSPGTGTDVDGLTRMVDGVGGGGARIDIGAHEFQAAMAPSLAEITASPNPAGIGVTVDFTASAVDPDGGAVTYAWDFGDSASGTGASPSHAYAASGDYVVKVTATDDEGKSSVNTTSVHVESTPPTTPTVGADILTAVRGQTITFTASGSSDPDGDTFTYEWLFTGGGVATGASVQRAASAMHSSGQIDFVATVKAVDEHGEESGTASVVVSIENQDPNTPSFTVSSPTNPRGGEFTFTSVGSDPDGDTLARNWSWGDGSPDNVGSVSTTASHTYSTLGVKTVTLTHTDPYSGSATYVSTVEVVDRAPEFTSAINTSGPALAGEAQAFSVSASDADGDPVSISWDFGDGQTANGGSASHVFAAPGTYNVKATATDGPGASATANLSVVIAARVPVFTVGKSPRKGFKRSGKSFVVSAKPSSRAITVTSNIAFSARLTLAKAKAGYAVGSKCSKRKPAKRVKRCDLKLAGSQIVTIPAGKSSLTFGGKWRGKRLPLGRYTLTVTPSGLKDGKKSVLSVVR